MKTRLAAAALLILANFAWADAPASTQPALAIGGDVEKPINLTLEGLAALPHVGLHVKDHDGSDATYSGVPLKDLLLAAGVPLGQHRTRGPQLAKFVLTTSADGYHVVFALAELDSDYVDKGIIVADARNGQPLDAKSGPLRLVVPGEGMQGRWARQLTSIEVRSAVK
jgi:DMSO/TMAO reductase YedYZ molybdopterin-dependent catalytic subunit